MHLLKNLYQDHNYTSIKSNLYNIKRSELLKHIDSTGPIQWCQNYGLIPVKLYCIYCKIDMMYYKNNSIFKCNQCMKKQRLLSNTIFEKSSIGIKKIITLLYEWTVKSPMFQMAHEYGIGKTTVGKWCKKFRLMACLFYSLESNEKVGGPGIIVEIDESLLVKNKYRRGRKLRGQQWVFAGIERSDKCKFFIHTVEKRNRDTLLTIIKDRILPGSIIMSDSWKAYENLPKLLPAFVFQHFQVKLFT